MVTIPFGYLPTRAGLATLGDLQGVSVDSLMRVMRASLQRHGPNEGLRELLRAVGFDWAPQSVTDLELDVAAVADALSSAAPSPVAQHSAAQSGAGASPFVSDRQTVPVTTEGAAETRRGAAVGDRGAEADLGLAAASNERGFW